MLESSCSAEAWRTAAPPRVNLLPQILRLWLLGHQFLYESRMECWRLKAKEIQSLLGSGHTHIEQSSFLFVGQTLLPVVSRFAGKTCWKKYDLRHPSNKPFHTPGLCWSEWWIESTGNQSGDPLPAQWSPTPPAGPINAAGWALMRQWPLKSRFCWCRHPGPLSSPHNPNNVPTDKLPDPLVHCADCSSGCTVPYIWCGTSGRVPWIPLKFQNGAASLPDCCFCCRFRNSCAQLIVNS